MNADSDKNDPLISLLKAKQSPQPSQEVLKKMSARIQEEIQNPPQSHTWWQRLITDMDMKACAVGISICALMLLGIMLAMNHDRKREAVGPYTTLDSQGRIVPATVVIVPLQATHSSNSAAPSTAPVLQQNATNSLLDITVAPVTEPVNYWAE